MMPRCQTDTYEGCKCNRTERHPNPHRCEHGVQWAVRPDGRFFVIYEDHAPDIKDANPPPDRRRPLCDEREAAGRDE